MCYQDCQTSQGKANSNSATPKTELIFLQKERNWLIGQFQRVAEAQHVRITFLSGDVHCAAVGVLKTLVKGKSKEVDPALDMRYMLNVCTSGRMLKA